MEARSSRWPARPSRFRSLRTTCQQKDEPSLYHVGGGGRWPLVPNQSIADIGVPATWKLSTCRASRRNAFNGPVPRRRLLEVAR
jgi:hypothetical protein